MTPSDEKQPEPTPEPTTPQITDPAPAPQQVTPQQPQKSSKAIIISISFVLLLVAGIIGGIFIQRYAIPSNPTTSLSPTQDGNTTTTQEEANIAAVAEKVSPSVVSIVTTTRSQSYYGTASQEGAGTGIIVSKDGYVLTNNHVIESASKISIVDSNGELYEDVTLIGRDPLNDVAFLKIKSDTEFTPAVLGNSSTTRIGQQVVAIGNALGQYSNTVTSGIISGTGRPITASTGSGQTESLTDLLQTDASINPGNSGGPLVNMAGQVIGINTAIVEDANGIGFSIPINATKGVLAEVLETGKATRAFIGVNYLSITPEIAREYNLPVRNGAYIYSATGSAVASGSPAEKAGLKQGDIITKINNDTLGSNGSLSSIIGQYRPNETVTVTYLRDGKEATTSLTLGKYTD